MAEGLAEGFVGGEEKEPETEATEAPVTAEAFAAAVAAIASRQDPGVARKTEIFLDKQARLLDTQTANRLRRRISISFNFVLALVMAAVVIYGFSHTIGDNLLYPSIRRPGLLYVHAAVFSSWIALYILQTSLIASRNVALHRRLGAAWIAVGTAMPIVGVTTGIAMRRFHILHDHETATFIAVILWDMVAFSTLFLLAILWRKRPEYHRRFMFLATCGLTDAGFGRFPLLAPLWSNANFWSDFGALYVGVDALLLIAMTRDLVVLRRVHVVYKVALPLIVTGQLLACVLAEHPPTLWTTLSRELVGVG